MPRKDEAPFQVVYIDLRGKMSVPSLGGSHWTFGAVCGRTNFLLLQHLRTKDQSSRALRRVLAVIHNLGFRVQKIRIDNVLLCLPGRGLPEGLRREPHPC